MKKYQKPWFKSEAVYPDSNISSGYQICVVCETTHGMVYGGDINAPKEGFSTKDLIYQGSYYYQCVGI